MGKPIGTEATQKPPIVFCPRAVGTAAERSAHEFQAQDGGFEPPGYAHHPRRF